MTQITTASASETFSIIAKEIAERKASQIRPKDITVTDSKGNEIKVGSLVKSKNSNIIREVLSYTDGSIVTSFNNGYRIRALRKGSHSQDWTFLKPSNVEVVD